MNRPALLFFPVLWYGQGEFRQDLLHIVPDFATVFFTIVPQEVRGVECGHKLNRRSAKPGAVLVELASQLAD